MARDKALTHDEAVEAVRKLDADAKTGRTLKFYCGVGRVVCSLGGGYGTSHVNALAAALAARGVVGLDTSSLHKAEKFVQALTPAQIQTLYKAGVSWRAASNLTSKHLSARRRDALIECVGDGRLKPADLGAEIKKRLGDEA